MTENTFDPRTPIIPDAVTEIKTAAIETRKVVKFS